MVIQNPGKRYHHEEHMVYSCQYHVIWCPKYRRRVLVNGIDTRLKELIRSKETDYGFSVIDLEVMPDHVHLLVDINPKNGVFDVITKIKGFTSKTLREEYPVLKSKLPTLWTRSKFISSVGAVTLERVKKYIENQKGV